MTRPIALPDYAARALAEGRLTQWRVRLKVQPAGHDICVDLGAGFYAHAAHDGAHMGGQWRLPFAPGDVRWVQETWAFHPMAQGRISPKGECHPWGSPIYKATFGAMLIPVCEGFIAWRSPVTMPKWASRWTMVVESVRIERVQDATIADAEDEGIEWVAGDHSRKESYARRWIARHGPGSWERNDWCAVATMTASTRKDCSMSILDTNSLPPRPAPVYWPVLPSNGRPPITPREVGLPDTFAPTLHIQQIDGRVSQLWVQLAVEEFGEASVWVDVAKGCVI